MRNLLNRLDEMKQNESLSFKSTNRVVDGEEEFVYVGHIGETKSI